MAPPPVERNGGDSTTTAGDATRSLPTPFLTKTYQLVDDHAIDDVISWTEDGSTFTVWNPTEFARDLLPKYFKHNNFSSFVRQLNTYGFRKVVPDRWEFCNDFFRRGEKRLLCDIQRRKIAAPVTAGAAAAAAAAAPAPAPPPPTVSPADSGEEQVISSTSSPAAGTSSGTTAELIGENDRLRKENIALNKELSQMKDLCGNIYVMMSNYATNKPESSSQAAVEPLDLLPEEQLEAEPAGVAATCGFENRTEAEVDTSARLFGVSIGVKRSRGGEGEAAYQELQLQQPGMNVKSEPLDNRDGGGDDQETPWVKHCHRSNDRMCN